MYVVLCVVHCVQFLYDLKGHHWDDTLLMEQSIDDEAMTSVTRHSLQHIDVESNHDYRKGSIDHPESTESTSKPPSSLKPSTESTHNSDHFAPTSLEILSRYTLTALNIYAALVALLFVDTHSKTQHGHDSDRHNRG
mmetsp:Transcript_23177/g.32405  ORF Transcript_23177/g.32405 Transcript_23177/m.32405 type:complete len:137 (-) Transcript_23177:1805-2215(-)